MPAAASSAEKARLHRDRGRGLDPRGRKRHRCRIRIVLIEFQPVRRIDARWCMRSSWAHRIDAKFTCARDVTLRPLSLENALDESAAFVASLDRVTYGYRNGWHRAAGRSGPRRMRGRRGSALCGRAVVQGKSKRSTAIDPAAALMRLAVSSGGPRLRCSSSSLTSADHVFSPFIAGSEGNIDGDNGMAIAAVQGAGSIRRRKKRLTNRRLWLSRTSPVAGMPANSAVGRQP
jgi:hypothetical protein